MSRIIENYIHIGYNDIITGDTDVNKILNKHAHLLKKTCYNYVNVDHIRSSVYIFFSSLIIIN